MSRYLLIKADDIFVHENEIIPEGKSKIVELVEEELNILTLKKDSKDYEYMLVLGKIRKVLE